MFRNAQVNADVLLVSACLSFSGYCSEINLEALESRHIDAYVATGPAKDAVADAAKGEAAAKGANATISPHTIDAPTRFEAMREKVKAGGMPLPPVSPTPR